MSIENNLRLWAAHLAGEFTSHDVEESLATMVEDASVIHVPTGSGGVGKAALRPYYRDLFIPSIPVDWKVEVTNRITDEKYIADEARLSFHHTKQMDWFLPGVPPTGKLVEVDLAIFVGFRDGLMSVERIYWDSATAMRQVGLLK